LLKIIVQVKVLSALLTSPKTKTLQLWWPVVSDRTNQWMNQRTNELINLTDRNTPWRR